MCCAFRLARAGGSGGATERRRAQKLVGSTGRDRSRLGENMNSPILQETVGKAACPAKRGVYDEASSGGGFDCGAHHRCLSRARAGKKGARTVRRSSAAVFVEFHP